MLSSVRALLSGIIDYAGMFPPAQLPLEQAIRNYARYRTEPENWMLGRFICPATRLVELSAFVDELFHDGPPLIISALVGGPGSYSTDITLILETDIKSIRAFHHRHGSRAIVDSFEAKMPLLRWDRFREDIDILQAVSSSYGLRETSGVEQWITYYEVGFTPGWRTELTLLQKAAVGDSPHRKGLKVRCGGASPGMIPSAHDIAAAITACQAAGVPLKFTAGLHHPVRHWDEQIQRYAHGFLNIFVAGVLADVHRLSMEQILPILEDRELSHFLFSEQALGWGEWRASIQQVESARRQAVISFGSCSFDEPREDLKALGLLP